ncbi:MAG: HTH domain-containing protein [Bacteroidales bacterium]|nr:HTH domain-containing protein [Bacteroidales bacterium]
MNDGLNIKVIVNDVIILSEDSKIISLAEKVTKDLKLNLIIANDTIDLYATGFFFGIIDPDKLEKDYFENFKEIHKNENPKEFCVLLTKPIKIPKTLLRYFILPDGPIEYQYLKLLILNRRSAIIRHLRSNKTYDKKLMRMFAILKKLQPTNSYVKHEELCQEFNVSSKTIKRDIEMINQWGESIEYDRTRKAYYLMGSWNSKIFVRED